MNIYVGNLSFDASEDNLRELFGAYGEVSSVNIIRHRDSGQSKGFGFVEMDDDGAQKAIDELNETEHMGRQLRVNVAKPRSDNRRSGGGGGGYNRGGDRW